MSAPIDTVPPASSATRAHATNVTAPTDSYGIAQKPVPERADPQQGEPLFTDLLDIKLMVAATGPGTGSVDTSNAVPFKEQVCSPFASVVMADGRPMGSLRSSTGWSLETKRKRRLERRRLKESYRSSRVKLEDHKECNQ